MIKEYLIQKKYLLLFLMLPAFIVLKAQDTINRKAISLLFIGDIMGHDSQIESAFDPETNSYSYDEVFKYIKPVLTEADIAIANFEVTLAGRPYKGYPQFSSPAELAAACTNAGIDYFVLANNHAADRGMNGIISTINKLDSMAIMHTGTYLNSAARDTLSPMMINRNGFSIALLNYTYGTNGIKVPYPVTVDSLDKNQVTNDIIKAKNKNSDVIILFLHWGKEYDTIPGSDQAYLADHFLKAGADLIIGSHPHVLQKMVWSKNPENGKEGMIVYSLGNFISNQRKPKTDGGSIVRITLTRDGDNVSILNAGYYLTWVYTPVINNRKEFFILPCSIYEKKPGFFNTPEEFEQMKRFIRDSRQLLNNQNVRTGEYLFEGESWILNN